MTTNNYPNSSSLNPVREVLSQAGHAINNPFHRSDVSVIPSLVEAVAVPGSAVAGGAVGVGALASAGTAGLGATGITTGLAALGSLVGGGMVAGIFVVAAPAIIFGAGAYSGVQYWKSRKLRKEKQELLDESLRQSGAITDLLKDETNSSEDRTRTLEHLNILLIEIIKNLKSDLEPKEAS